MDYSNVCSEKIKELLNKSGESQARLAEIIGTSQSWVNQVLNHKKNFTLEILVTIADHFHVSLDYLTGRNNNELGYITDNLGAAYMALIELNRAGLISFPKPKLYPNLKETYSVILENPYLIRGIKQLTALESADIELRDKNDLMEIVIDRNAERLKQCVREESYKSLSDKSIEQMAKDGIAEISDNDLYPYY